MSMKSRAQKTFKEDKDDFDDGFMWFKFYLYLQIKLFSIILRLIQ